MSNQPPAKNSSAVDSGYEDFLPNGSDPKQTNPNLTREIQDPYPDHIPSQSAATSISKKEEHMVVRLDAPNNPYPDCIPQGNVTYQNIVPTKQQDQAPSSVKDQPSTTIATTVLKRKAGDAEDPRETKKARQEPEEKVRAYANILKNTSWIELQQCLFSLLAGDDDRNYATLNALCVIYKSFRQKAKELAMEAIDLHKQGLTAEQLKSRGYDVNESGVAGGVKLIKEGIFLKIAAQQTSNGRFANYSIPFIHMGHEIKNLAILEDYEGKIKLPMGVLLDYASYRVYCCTYLPISSNTLVNGSEDAATSSRNKLSDDIRNVLDEITKKMNLKFHAIKTGDLVPFGADLEGHLAYDGLYYLIDIPRLLPAEVYSLGKFDGRNRLCNRLRIEFVRNTKYNPFALNSDTGESFTGSEEDAEDVENLERASNTLVTTVIPQLCERISALYVNVSLQDNGFDSIVGLMHVYGVNLRFLGEVFNIVHKKGHDNISKYLVCEMIARTLKSTLRERWHVEFTSAVTLKFFEEFFKQDSSVLLRRQVSRKYLVDENSIAFEWNNEMRMATLGRLQKSLGLTLVRNGSEFTEVKHVPQLKATYRLKFERATLQLLLVLRSTVNNVEDLLRAAIKTYRKILTVTPSDYDTCLNCCIATKALALLTDQEAAMPHDVFRWADSVCIFTAAATIHNEVLKAVSTRELIQFVRRKSQLVSESLGKTSERVERELYKVPKEYNQLQLTSATDDALRNSYLQCKLQFLHSATSSLKQYYELTEDRLSIYPSMSKLHRSSLPEIVLDLRNTQRKVTALKLDKSKIRIAIDPLYFGGAYATIEDKLFTVNGVKFNCGDYNYDMAKELVLMLIKDGYSPQNIMLTHNAGESALQESWDSFINNFQDSHSCWFRDIFSEIGDHTFSVSDFIKECAKCKDGNLNVRSTLESYIFRNIFNQRELQARVDKINNFNPDLTICVGTFVATPQNGDKITQPTDHVPTHYAFVPGWFLGDQYDELKFKRWRIEFLRLLVSDNIEKSLALTEHILGELNHTHNVLSPPNNQNPNWCTVMDNIGCRNLKLTKLVTSPIAYLTPFVINHAKIFEQLMTDKQSLMERTASAITNGINRYLFGQFHSQKTLSSQDRCEEYLKTLEYKLLVNVHTQQLLVLTSDGEIVNEYSISTAANGEGERSMSYCTPRGKHRIAACIGAGEPVGTIFKDRKPVGLWTPDMQTTEDLILTRVLWLEGLEPSNSNTKDRKIYIHGTNQEQFLGQKKSHGCIRMSNEDVLELFDMVHIGTHVEIVA